jgi:leucyl aminopeptidase (aminopeptidase T)
LTFQKGKIVNVSGDDRLLVSRLNRWLDTIDGDTGRLGPVHFNVGLNPHARLTEHPEFEKIRGTVVMGIGDSSLLTRMWSPGRPIEAVTSDVHWDFIVMRPTIALDAHVICASGVMADFTD